IPTGPTVSQVCGVLLKIGPIANASAGSVNAPTATAPATLALPVMNRRRVTVSPSNAPGIIRSAVYLDLYLCLSATNPEQYRGPIHGEAAGTSALVRIASSASGALDRASCLARLCS